MISDQNQRDLTRLQFASMTLALKLPSRASLGADRARCVMLLRMTLDPRTPVLIGQGQVLDRSVDPTTAKHPVALMAEALTHLGVGIVETSRDGIGGTVARRRPGP